MTTKYNYFIGGGCADLSKYANEDRTEMPFIKFQEPVSVDYLWDKSTPAEITMMEHSYILYGRTPSGDNVYVFDRAQKYEMV